MYSHFFKTTLRIVSKLSPPLNTKPSLTPLAQLHVCRERISSSSGRPREHLGQPQENPPKWGEEPKKAPNIDLAGYR